MVNSVEGSNLANRDKIAREEPHKTDIRNEETNNDTPPSATTAKTYPILTQPTNRYVHTSHKHPKKTKDAKCKLSVSS